jgi:TPR repeat protein
MSRNCIRFLPWLFLGLLSISGMAGPLEEGTEAFRKREYQRALILLQPLAEQGNAQAQGLVGVMYLRGSGPPEDLKVGLDWERKAAEQGLADAQVQLGRAYSDGLGVKQDYAQAMKWFLKAADQGDSTAQLSISGLYADGLGVRKDKAKAQKWYTKSIRRPNLPSEVVAGLESDPAITLYSLQPWGGPDISEWDFRGHHMLGLLDLDKAQAQTAVRALKDAVSAGNANLSSMCITNPRHALRFQADGHTFEILICYQCGQLELYRDEQWLPFYGMIGGKPDVLNGLLKAAKIPLADAPSALKQSYTEEAKVALEKAEQGDAKAQDVFARMLMMGRGVKKNEAEGIQWLAKSLAMSPDNPEFQVNLARMYRRGEHLPKDHSAAMDLLRKAAALGNSDAIYYMGQLYDLGNGVPKNAEEAIKLFRQAAEGGNAKAQFEIGVRLAQGRDVKENHEEALRWLRKAAEQSHPEALYWMSTMYERGWGVPKDLAEAYFWDRLALEYNTIYGNRVSASLTSEQLAAIDKRVTEWKAAHPERPRGLSFE